MRSLVPIPSSRRCPLCGRWSAVRHRGRVIAGVVGWVAAGALTVMATRGSVPVRWPVGSRWRHLAGAAVSTAAGATQGYQTGVQVWDAVQDKNTPPGHCPGCGRLRRVLPVSSTVVPPEDA